MSKVQGRDFTEENVSKEKLINVIKTSKNEYDNFERETGSHISEIIKKMESKIPSYVKLYSDLYKKYLQIMNDSCNRCYSNQKQVLSKMGMDNTALATIDVYRESIKQMVLFQIDMNEMLIKTYVGFRLGTLDLYSQMMNSNIFDFMQMLPRLNYPENTT